MGGKKHTRNQWRKKTLQGKKRKKTLQGKRGKRHYKESVEENGSKILKKAKGPNAT